MLNQAQIRTFARPHAPNERFSVVAVAFDKAHEPVGQPLERLAVEPELAMVIAVSELQRHLETAKTPWHTIEVVIQHK